MDFPQHFTAGLGNVQVIDQGWNKTDYLMNAELNMIPKQHQASHLPAYKNMRNGGSLDWPIATEGKPRLTMNVLRISCVGAIIALIDRNIYPSTFWMIL